MPDSRRVHCEKAMILFACPVREKHMACPASSLLSAPDDPKKGPAHNSSIITYDSEKVMSPFTPVIHVTVGKQWTV